MILEGVTTDWQGWKLFNQVKVAMPRWKDILSQNKSPAFKILQVKRKSKVGFDLIVLSGNVGLFKL